MTQVEIAVTIAPEADITQKLQTALIEAQAAIDIIELRIDQRQTFEIAEIETLIAALRKSLPKVKLLITYRTASQGGNGNKAQESYYALLQELMQVQGYDMIDIEWEEAYKEKITELVAEAQAAGLEVVLSQHDFEETPAIEQLKFTYFKMSKTEADYLKLAVMPKDPEDVTYLLDALYVSSQSVKMKVVGISMSHLGLVSRTAQGVFGGSISYGCLGEPQAPGQIHVTKLKEILTLYESNK
ncbi:type I 3-dehydroquinate dehydratase [Staphylococcus simulans]|uniref:type I 3-dehydroquinate dehydratase n=1 Tax=Staphylococcus simulans TaxID=1286 RepID=UPI000CD2DBD9|nr:type I 3-dehydroquinate dehydratase [Staphylococcus simulans]PNZ42340.1 type I 3-dehydroquinate dehydratase [Staphylococcus simulans]SQE74926.1 3-dehydroquinate dehydratase [Staphylococcus simulans]